MKIISVLVVEDSATMRLLLEEVISSDPRLALAGSCPDAEGALAFLKDHRPDVVSMDILLPGIDGVEAIRRILAEMALPIVVISSTASCSESRHAMEALHAGALAVLPKPEGPDSSDFEKHCRRIADQLVAMSQVRVIRRMRTRAEKSASSPAASGPVPVPAARRARSAGIEVVGIAASTGGPVVLVDLLGALPSDYPLPILLVQHIAPGFAVSFAEWLDGCIPPAVACAVDGEPVRPGRVYLAPDGRHLALRGGRVALLDTPPSGVHKPSANVLFESLARECGPRAAGVILTGMGRDGAAGLAAMRRAGAWTCGQNEESCAVFGMPQAARDAGGVDELLSTTEISRRLASLRVCQA